MLLMFRRSKKSWQRGMTIEHTLIAVLTASAAFQFLIIVGVKIV
jgi:hypothetical protein